MIDFEKYMIPAEEGIIINALKRAGERQNERLKKENQERIAKEKASVNVDEFYSQFHVTPGNRDQLRSAMFKAIYNETKKIIDKTNRNKSIMKSYIDRAIKEMTKDYDDKEYLELVIEDEFTGECKFTCDEDEDPFICGIYIGNDFGQEGCVRVVGPFVNEVLVPALRKKFSNLLRVVDFFYGGDGDEGFMAIDFKF